MTSLTPLCQKRLVGDLRLLKNDPLEFLDALPDEKDLLTWYFIVKGPESSDFKGGYYLGKIMHSPEYPFKSPDFMMLTPNGRFMDNKKICLSNSSYHSSEWSAMWNVKSILMGFLSIMLDDNENGISHIHDSKQSRSVMAANSIQYNKQHHFDILKKFTRFVDINGDPLIVSPIVEPVIAKPVVQPVVEPVIVQPIVQPVVEPIIEPIVEPLLRPDVQPVPEPVPVPIEKPVVLKKPRAKRLPKEKAMPVKQDQDIDIPKKVKRARKTVKKVVEITAK